MPSHPPLQSSRTAWRTAARAALALVVVCGCDRTPPDRCDVTGEVTLDNTPLASGAVTLRPRRKGQTTGATIRAGKFAIAGDKAPKFGKYRVEIEAYLPTGKQIPDPDNPAVMAEDLKQVLPDRYNRRSTLEIEITPDSDHHLTFYLKSK